MKDDQTIDRNEEVQSKEEQAQDETAAMENKYLRAIADYRNLERQTQTWKEEFSQYATVPLIKKILEVLDNLEKAQEHLQDDGIALIIAQLKKIIDEVGVKEITLENKPYDPNLAEVIGTEVGEEKDIILRVLQKGYQLHDRVIRPAKVVVSTTKESGS